MSGLHPGITGRKTRQPSPKPQLPPPLPPLLVDVLEARRMLGNISKNKFWEIARHGEIELVGSERKRFAVVASLQRYVDKLPRRDTTAA
jgi:hypothetical protein